MVLTILIDGSCLNTCRVGQTEAKETKKTFRERDEPFGKVEVGEARHVGVGLMEQEARVEHVLVSMTSCKAYLMIERNMLVGKVRATRCDVSVSGVTVLFKQCSEEDACSL
jgi:hypothetical protein